MAYPTQIKYRRVLRAIRLNIMHSTGGGLEQTQAVRTLIIQVFEYWQIHCGSEAHEDGSDPRQR